MILNKYFLLSISIKENVCFSFCFYSPPFMKRLSNIYLNIPEQTCRKWSTKFYSCHDRLQLSTVCWTVCNCLDILKLSLPSAALLTFCNFLKRQWFVSIGHKAIRYTVTDYEFSLILWGQMTVSYEQRNMLYPFMKTQKKISELRLRLIKEQQHFEKTLY